MKIARGGNIALITRWLELNVNRVLRAVINHKKITCRHVCCAVKDGTRMEQNKAHAKPALTTNILLIVVAPNARNATFQGAPTAAGVTFVTLIQKPKSKPNHHRSGVWRLTAKTASSHNGQISKSCAGCSSSLEKNYQSRSYTQTNPTQGHSSVTLAFCLVRALEGKG